MATVPPRLFECNRIPILKFPAQVSCRVSSLSGDLEMTFRGLQAATSQYYILRKLHRVRTVKFIRYNTIHVVCGD